MTKCRSKVKEPCSSSITSALNEMPTSVINSPVVLMVRLICHDEKVYEKVIFCKTSQHKSQLHFPSQSNRACTKLTLSNNQTFDQEEIKPIDYFPIAHNTLCLPPKFCITYCLKMLLGKCNTPRSI